MKTLKMCSTTVSNYIWYNPSVAYTRCGEVFCSQKFDDFKINCSTCSLEFNLLSCTLFIKHVKECTSATSSELEIRDVGNQDIPSFDTIESSIYTTAENNNTIVPIPENNLDPLLLVKVEKFEVQEETLEDIENLSDYQDEDDLTIDKVARRKNTEELINEYKKHPALWDGNEKKSISAEIFKKDHYKEIREAVNSKLKTNITYRELRSQILRLRSAYKRVLERKEKIEKGFNDGNVLLDKLWYFDKLSFIGAKSSDIEIESDPNDSDQDELPKPNDDQNTNSSKQLERKVKKRTRCDPKMISDIIAQYKKYSLLWDQTAPLYRDIRARKDSIRQITTFINTKFNKNLTDKQLMQQIINLRSVYHRNQRKSNRADNRIRLWYFNKFSFLDDKCATVENCPITEEHQPENEVIVKDEGPVEFPTLNLNENFEIHEPKFDEDGEDASNEGISDNLNSDKKCIISLIDEYQRHPCLWDNDLYRTSSRSSRSEANKEITNTINEIYKTTFSETDIKKKILTLKNSYRRVLRKREAFEKQHANANKKFHPQLWYFDKMTFIGDTEIGNDFMMSCSKKQTLKSDNQSEEGDENAMYQDSDEGSILDAYSLPEDKPDISEENLPEEPNSSVEIKTKNRDLVIALIEEYKKQPILWATKHNSSNKSARRKAYLHLVEVINAKFDTEFTPQSISYEIIKLRTVYKRMLRRKQDNPDGEFKSRVWYADLLSFIDERKPKGLQKESEDPTICLDDDQADCSNFDQNNDSDADEETNRRRTMLNNTEHVYEIIDLYKASPILWDTSHTHHQYNLRNEQKKAINKIIYTLSLEHNCQLTAEDFRYQIRLLKNSYSRAVRQGTRPFFFDRMSFLKPFLGKRTPLKSEATSEDFKYLTENKKLMIDFIEIYKTQSCLWDPQNKDRYNSRAHTGAYHTILNMFSQNGVVLTHKKLTAAINFLRNTAVNSQKKTRETPVWFYEHLQFLCRIPRIKNKYCDHCDQYFRKNADYEKHKIEIAGDYPYKCSICKAGFMTRSKYSYHQITHNKPYRCEQCGFQAYNKGNFDVHIRRHKGIQKFKCIHCEKGFVTSTDLKRHLRIHTGEKPFVCDTCGKSMASNSDIYEHMKRHRNQRDHKCDVCGNAFFSPQHLKDHMVSHSTERKHVCDVCSAAFKRYKTLYQHKKLHAETKKHKCKICGKSFAQQAGIYSHMKSHDLVVGN